MDLRISMQHGLSFGLVMAIPRRELRDMRLSLPGWGFLRDSYGIARHPVGEISEEDLNPTASYDPLKREVMPGSAGIVRYKLAPEEHLKALIPLPDHRECVSGLNLLDSEGYVKSRVVVIGNRNLGNNYGFIAWDSGKSPNWFSLRNEPIDQKTYTSLIWAPSGGPAIAPVRFEASDGGFVPVHANGPEALPDDIAWLTYGQQVLRSGDPVDIEEIIDQFYDIRHLFYFNLAEQEEQNLLRDLTSLYGDPAEFRKQLLELWLSGRPRSRYLHNAIGVGPDRLVIVQRYGTPEEIGVWLRDAGATDGILLDNGGSTFTWGWWAGVGTRDGRRRGGVIFSSPDWRPPSISVIAIVLNGAVRHDEPPGSIGFTVT